MSKDLSNQKNNSEEVDLIVFFNLIGNAFNKLLSFIASIFKAIFSLIINAIKVIIKYWLLIIGVLLISGIIGYILERKGPSTYQSEMLVRPYFDSKYQLVNNIGYFNALISNKDYKELDKIFNSKNTPKVDVKDIKGFKIESGPETENDRIIQFQEFTQKLDTIGRREADFERFVEERSIYSGNLFLITAKSNKKDIFKNLTYGINTAFTNAFSSSKKIKDSLLYEIQKENINESLREVEKLQDIYIQALQQQAKNPAQRVKAGELLLTREKELDTKEYALLDKELALRNALRVLEEKRVTEDVFVDVISSFQPVGSQETQLRNKYSLVFPVLAFIILCLFFLVTKTIIYAKNYEE